MRNALTKADEILAAAGGTLADVVEMTSDHVGLREHWGEVEPELRDALGMPLPAWRAVEVAGLRREWALIELRLVAHLP